MNCRCENCKWTGDIEETNPVDDFWERVQPGEIMPAGECPECRSLAVPTTDNDFYELSSQGRRAIAADDLLRALKNLSKAVKDTPALDGCADWQPILEEADAAILKATEPTTSTAEAQP